MVHNLAMARKNNSSKKEISEILADSNSDLDTEVCSCSDDSTSNSDIEQETKSSKKKKREFLKWKSGRFVPKSLYFNNEDAGIPSDLCLGKDPLDYFELFFDQNIMEYIVEETNRYQQQNSSSSSKTSHQAKWYATNSEEMYTFIATTMLMGIVQKNKVRDYWSMDPVITTPIFRELFSRDRYCSLMRMLHFVNNDENNTEKLYKILPIVLHMKDKFQQFFKPYQNLCIDESVLVWKGRLSFKQYIPSKRHRFGVKLFILCDCETKYILDFIIYTGADTQIELINNLGISGSVVMTLMKPYLRKGHILYVDNWYTSPKLFLELYNQDTGGVGTVKRNRSGMPCLKQKLNRGEQVYRNCESILVVKWMDKREVYMLSTVHDSQMIATEKIDYVTGKQILKPICVQNYNENMGAIDLVDMQSSFTECIRKTVKWYKKVFFHIVDMASINSFYLYKTKNSKNIQLKEFRLQLIKNIISKYGSQKSISIGRPPTDSPLRLSARHFPSLVPSTSSKKAAQRKCYVCSHTTQGKQSVTYTRYQCEECDVGLCVVDCFKAYHTLKHF